MENILLERTEVGLQDDVTILGDLVARVVNIVQSLVPISADRRPDDILNGVGGRAKLNELIPLQDGGMA